MIYFAYGSNTNLEAFATFIRAHRVSSDGLQQVGRAVLDDYRLRTNYLSNTHLAGACNIEPAPGRHVEGVVMRICEGILEVLRYKEGYPQRYAELEVTVTRPDGQAITAMTYRVQPSHRRTEDLPVTAAYRRKILTGARRAGLSADYVDFLESALTIQQGDS